MPVRGKVGDLASIYSFNPTGSLIWKILETPTTLPEIAVAIAREFEVTRAQAESDVVRFVKEMFSAGLVEVLDGCGPGLKASGAGRTGSSGRE